MKARRHKSITSIVVFQILLSSFASVWAAGSYHGGSGTVDDPYQIITAAHLMELGEHTEDYGKHFILLADIDMDPDIPGNKKWDRAVIAPNDNNSDNFNMTPFNGTFDGNGKKIKNLYFHYPSTSHIGLFGKVGIDGTVMNLGVLNVFIDDYFFSSYNVGYLIGENDGFVVNCESTGKRNIDNINSNYKPTNIGGLAGKNTGIIFDCHSGGNIIHGRNAGGLVGFNLNGYINMCYSTCDLIDCSSYCGGLVGVNEGAAVISYSYATGNVTGGSSGGLVGYSGGNNSEEKAVINRCYATGSVPKGYGLVSNAGYHSVIKNSYSIGICYGLIGSFNNNYSKAINCFMDVDTSNTTSSYPGAGLSTSEMKQEQTFVDAGWDFDSTWEMIEGKTYPYFQWQEDPLENSCKDGAPFPVGDLNSDCVVNLEDLAMLCENWLVDIRR